MQETMRCRQRATGGDRHLRPGEEAQHPHRDAVVDEDDATVGRSRHGAAPVREAGERELERLQRPVVRASVAPPPPGPMP